MNMPEEFKPPTGEKSSINLPLPDLRADIERIKSQKSQEGETTGRTIPVGFPLIDLTKPPPGYNPYGFSQNSDQEYDEKVRRFLQETTSEPRRSEGGRERSHQASGDRKSRREKRRKSRSRERSSRSSRSSRREKSKEKEERRSKRSRGSSGSQQSKGGEPILIDDDDFTKKLNDHLTGSENQTEPSHSSEQKSHRDKSQEGKSSGGSKDKLEKRKSSSNVFGSEDELNSSREENVRSRVPSGGGMWIPTGQDSIIDGVKEAINKLGGREKTDKHRSQSGSEKKTISTEAKDNYEIKFDKRTGMYIRMPKDAAAGQNGESKGSEDVIEVKSEARGSRTGEKSPTKLPSKRRSKSKSKERKESRRRSRSRSRGRRSRSRNRRRSSKSRDRRKSKSRSRKRSKRSRSRERRRKSRSRERRSRSRSNERSWKERGSYQDAQSSLQQEISGK